MESKQKLRTSEKKTKDNRYKVFEITLMINSQGKMIGLTIGHFLKSAFFPTQRQLEGILCNLIIPTRYKTTSLSDFYAVLCFQSYVAWKILLITERQTQKNFLREALDQQLKKNKCQAKIAIEIPKKEDTTSLIEKYRNLPALSLPETDYAPGRFNYLTAKVRLSCESGDTFIQEWINSLSRK